MPRVLGWAAVLAVVAAIVAYFWTQRQGQPVVPVTPPAIEAPLPLEEPAVPQVQFPLPPVAREEPLPKLEQSDEVLRSALSGLNAGPTLVEQVVFEDFVRRVVATIDNLPREKVHLRLLPVKTAPGRLETTTDLEGIRLKPENSFRYALYMRAVEAVDPKRMVDLYVRYYPLFQQAYRDLGYPKGYFNDRLIEVIDHLLATPQVLEPVRLVQPKVMYQFADAAMEGRSAGQKLLMRIGNANAATVKEKLRTVRRELVARSPEAYAQRGVPTPPRPEVEAAH
jgi:hypothetical protein